MKILKIIGLGVAGFIALMLIIAVFLKKDYEIVREVKINKSRMEVFNYIKLLKNQSNYSVWATQDPKMKKVFKGTDGSVGAISAWDSELNDVGKGEQEIKQITEGERIDFELRFIKPFKAKDNAYMITESLTTDQTLLKWGFKGKMNYPMNIMMLFINLDKSLGGQLQTGLDNLKTLMEKQGNTMQHA